MPVKIRALREQRIQACYKHYRDNRKLATNMGIWYPLIALSSEKICILLSILANFQPEPQQGNVDPLSTRVDSSLSGIFKYEDFLEKYKDKIKAKLTRSEIIDFFAIYKLGFDNSNNKMYSHYYKDSEAQYHLSGDELLKHHLSKYALLERFLKGLQLLGFLCVIDNN